MNQDKFHNLENCVILSENWVYTQICMGHLMGTLMIKWIWGTIFGQTHLCIPNGTISR
jgi:ArsR family metal-binding transcriptional regulator